MKNKRDAQWDDAKFDFEIAVRLWNAEQSAIDRNIYPKQQPRHGVEQR